MTAATSESQSGVSVTAASLCGVSDQSNSLEASSGSKLSSVSATGAASVEPVGHVGDRVERQSASASSSPEPIKALFGEVSSFGQSMSSAPASGFVGDVGSRRQEQPLRASRPFSVTVAPSASRRHRRRASQSPHLRRCRLSVTESSSPASVSVTGDAASANQSGISSRRASDVQCIRLMTSRIQPLRRHRRI